MAAVIKKNTDSSTATPIIQEHQNCSGCPQYLSPQSGSTSGQPSEVQLLVQCLTQMGEMQLEEFARKIWKVIHPKLFS